MSKNTYIIEQVTIIVCDNHNINHYYYYSSYGNNIVSEFLTTFGAFYVHENIRTLYFLN